MIVQMYMDSWYNAKKKRGRNMRRNMRKAVLSLMLAGLVGAQALPVRAQTQWYDDSDIVRADISYEL